VQSRTNTQETMMNDLVTALQLALRSMERSCLQAGFDPANDTECKIVRAVLDDAVQQRAVEHLLAIAQQPEDQPRTTYMSARESALDEQAADYDREDRDEYDEPDWSVEEEQLHERRMLACDR
jgi:hypothetical protein